MGLAIALAAAIAVMSIVWEALHPRRRCMAWALANDSADDPTALGCSADQWRFWPVRTHDGVEFPVWDLDGHTPSGPIVIIVHGWGRSRWDSLRRAPHFLTLASRVVLPDLRGHGEAGGRTRLGAIEADDLVTLMDLLDPSRTTPMVLVGHSMGAGVVIRAALKRPIAGVIALAPYERVVTPISARLFLRALPVWPFAGAAVALLRVFGIGDRPLSRDAAQLTTPLLVVSAEHDLLAPVEDGRAIAAAVPAGRGHFATMPGGSHADPGIADPIDFDARLRAFVSSRLSLAAAD